MKKLILLTISIIIQIEILGCSFNPETFCNTIKLFPENIIVHGVITAIDNDGLDLETIEIIKGTESKNKIRIWDATDFDCNGIHDMSANTIGNVGDTIVISLPQIAEIENEWDIIGDYRTPDPYIYYPRLKIQDGIATGLILGDATFPPEVNLLEIELESLKEKLTEDGDCSNLTSNISSTIISKQTKVINPVFSYLEIEFPEQGYFSQISILTMNGQELKTEFVSNQKSIQIQMQHFQSGIYILQMQNHNGLIEMRKIVKT